MKPAALLTATAGIAIVIGLIAAGEHRLSGASDADEIAASAQGAAEQQTPSPAQPDEPAGADHPRLAALTPREVEVMRAVAEGRSNAEISAELYVAEATVKTPIGRILHKLVLRDRVQMVLLAYDTGLVAV